MKKSSKKIIAATMAATMIAAMGNMGVMADDNGSTTKKTSDTTTVKYTVSESYAWSVPSEINFGENKGVNKTDVEGSAKQGEESKVKVTKNVIAEGKQLSIAAYGSGISKAFTIKNGDTGKEVLSYVVKKGNETASISPNDVILKVASGTNTGEVGLTFTLNTTEKTAEVAGNYTGTVTYTASVVDQQSN